MGKFMAKSWPSEAVVNRFKLNLLSGSFLGAAGLMMVAANASAQEALPEDMGTEVIVTVQKREQSVQKVPASVTALTGNFLQSVGVNDFAQLSRFVPGFEVQDQSPNNPGFVIRGITSDSGEATAETRVSVFQDGVSISRSRGSYVELFDLNRVEVVKGPQSTLFGRGALIGAVNVVQNRASTSGFDAAASVGIGNLNYKQFDGMVNMPLSDTLAVRIAGRVKERDGYVENLLGGDDFNSLDTAAWRMALKWAPSDDVSFDLIYNFQEDNNSGTSFKSGTYRPYDPATGAALGTTSFYDGAALSSGYGFKGGRDLGLERTVEGLTLLSTWRLSDSLSLSSITASREFDSSEVFDPDGFSLPMLVFAEDAKGEQFSQELRLNFAPNEKLTGFVGASYFHEEGSQAVPLQINEKMVFLLLNSALPAPNGYPTATVDYAVSTALGSTTASLLKNNHYESYANYGETDSWDVFADMTYAVTPRFELSLGLRYTQDDKTSGYSATSGDNSALAALQYAQGYTTTYATNFYLANGFALPAAQQQLVFQTAFSGALALPLGLFVQPTTGNGNRIDKSFKDDGMTYRLVGRYAFSDLTNGYISVARGRQPKNFSTTGPSSPYGGVTFSEIKSETADSVELGLKSRSEDGRLSWDVAVYNYQYDNFRTQITSGAQVIEASAGEANAYGLEAQSFFRLAKGVDLFGSYAYSHARFGNGLYKGNQFRLNPDHKASIGARLHKQTAQGTWSVTPTYSWQSEIFFDDDNDTTDAVQNEKQASYGLLNLRVGFEPAGKPWSVEMFVDNALDQDYIKDAGNTGDVVGIPTFISGAPMTWGLVFRYKH